MTWVAVSIISGVAALGSAGAGLYAAHLQAEGAKDAAKTTADATKEANALQERMYDQTRQDFDPWRTEGVNALGQLSQMANDAPFGMQDFQADPGYAFRMAEGMKALERSAAARGGLLGSSHQKNIQRFGQDLASTEYQNAFNRYQVDRNTRINALQSVAGIGHSANSQVGHAGQNFANNSADLVLGGANALAQGQMAAANARASGYMGAANTLNNALGSYLNYSQGQNLLNRIYPQTPTPVPTPTVAPAVPAVTSVPTTTSGIPTHYTSGY